MTTTRAVVGSVLLVLGVTVFIVFPTVGSTQPGPYVPPGPVFGDLTIEGDDRTPGSTVTFVGDGFAPNSPVEASLTANRGGAIVLTVDGTADSAGEARVDVLLAETIHPAPYTAKLRGQTADASLVEWSSQLIVVAPEPTPQVECAGRPATIVGTAGDDILRGTSRADVIAGLAGNDEITGLAGDDVICAGPGADIVRGGAGADQILGQGGRDSLRGNGGNDDISGGGANDRIWGGKGADDLAGGKGSDRIKGNGGADTIRGGSKADTLWGGSGRDNLRGNGGPDDLRGGKGSDRCRGGGGADELSSCER